MKVYVSGLILTFFFGLHVSCLAGLVSWTSGFFQRRMGVSLLRGTRVGPRGAEATLADLLRSKSSSPISVVWHNKPGMGFLIGAGP